MSRKKIAICDMEQVYVHRLVNCVQKSRDGSFQLMGIADVDQALNLMDEVDVWVLGEAFWTKELLQREHVILLGSGYIPDVLSEYPVINKYQTASGLIKSIYRSAVWAKLHQNERKIGSCQTEVVGIYSAHPHAMQKAFSLTLALELSKKGKVLYLNLQENAGLQELLHIDAEKHLGDFVYLMREQKQSVELKGYTTEFQGIELLIPMQQGTQLSELTKADYKELVDTAKAQGEYRYIVIDFERMFHGFFELFTECEQMILLTDQGECARCAKEQFLCTMRLYEQKQSYETMQEIAFPVCEDRSIETSFISDLCERKYQAYVRPFLEKIEQD